MKCSVDCGNWPEERGVSVSLIALTFLPRRVQRTPDLLNVAASIFPREAAELSSSSEIMKVWFPVGTMLVVEAQPAIPRKG